jgi:hypothetical protein
VAIRASAQATIAARVAVPFGKRSRDQFILRALPAPVQALIEPDPTEALRLASMLLEAEPYDLDLRAAQTAQDVPGVNSL